MRLILSAFIVFNIGSIDGIAQSTQIQSGPMIGQVQLRDAIIWVQTKEPSKVELKYRPRGAHTESEGSEILTTDATHAYIATFFLHGLLPETEYIYSVIVNDEKQIFDYELKFKTQPHWQYRKDAPNFSFAVGSCAYVNDPSYDRPGKPYGSNYHIYKAIDSIRPDMMLWLGDNTYLREGDFESRAGIYNRYTHTRSLPEMRSLMAHTPNYAIWDDHDYGTNDANRTFRLKNHSLDAFKDFWPSEYYHTCQLEGITHSFTFYDCEFFMLDNRWYKSADTSTTILGEKQKSWFMDALLGSKAKYKFCALGGQFLSDFKGHENMANYAKERTEIIDFIDRHKIKNVIFLTGDRHHSELTKLITKSQVTIYDVTSSALTSGTYDHSGEPNTYRVSGSMIGQNNFALIKVEGHSEDRKLTLEFYGSQGQVLKTYNLY